MDVQFSKGKIYRVYLSQPISL